jgi:hypothetical protein
LKTLLIKHHNQQMTFAAPTFDDPRIEWARKNEAAVAKRAADEATAKKDALAKAKAHLEKLAKVRARARGVCALALVVWFLLVTNQLKTNNLKKPQNHHHQPTPNLNLNKTGARRAARVAQEDQPRARGRLQRGGRRRADGRQAVGARRQVRVCCFVCSALGPLFLLLNATLTPPKSNSNQTKI